MTHFKLTLEGETVKQGIDRVPVGTTTLSLSNNGLGKSSTDEFIFALKSIPNNITSLDLSNNELKLKTAKELIEIFSNIPFHITSLGLSNNNLGGKRYYESPEDEFAEVLSALPKSLTSLDLSYNRLGIRGSRVRVDIEIEVNSGKKPIKYAYRSDNLQSERLEKILAAIPEGVKTLDFSGTQALQDLSNAITKIPPNVETLIWRRNYREQLSDAFLKQFFAAIPETVKTLDLGESFFTQGDLRVEKLLLILNSIPNTITTLKLDNNDLGSASPSDLALIFSALPKNITTLDLSSNSLGLSFLDVDNERINKAFHNLPSSVSHLILSSNSFDLLPKARLTQIIASIPPTVITVTFDSKHFGYSGEVSRSELLKKVGMSTDNSFYLKCLCGIATIGATAALVAGYVLLSIPLAITGALLAVGAIGCGVSTLGLFSTKPTSEPQYQQQKVIPPMGL